MWNLSQYTSSRKRVYTATLHTSNVGMYVYMYMKIYEYAWDVA